jgi:hypothetical protein
LHGGGAGDFDYYQVTKVERKMKKNTLRSLALVAALAGTVAAVHADTYTYGINLAGSGWQGVGYVNGGSPFLQVASVGEADGWFNRTTSGVEIPREFNLNIYAGDSPAFYDLVADSLVGPNFHIDGIVSAKDTTSGAFNNIGFIGGYLASVGFPALTEGSVGSSYLSATLVPYATAVLATSAPSYTASTGTGWSEGTFGVTVAGTTTTTVKSVAAITITDQEHENSTWGPTHDPSDLVLTLPTSELSGFQSWLSEPGSALDKRTGSVTYYDATPSHNKIGTLHLDGLIVRGITPVHIYDSPSAAYKNVYMTISKAHFTR